VSPEAILSRDPVAVFVGTGQRENLLCHVVLGALTAVQEGNVQEISAANVVSIHVVEVLRKMAQVLHPEAFEEG